VSWPISRLGEVISFVRGVTFTPEDQVEPFSEGSTVVMRTKNVQVAGLDQSDLIAVPSGFVRRKEQELREGDILVSSANSWELVGKASYVPRLTYEATAGGFISIVRAKESRIDSRYLYHWVAYPATQHKIRHCGRQTTNISNLDVGRFQDLEIPLPPLPEQKRIAAILDKADVIRRKRQQAIQLAHDFLRAVFLDMFGDPVTNPKGWEVKPLGDVLKLTSGNGLSAKEMDSSGSYPVYGGNGVSGHHSEYMFKEPQLVIGRVGAYCGVVHITQPYSWVTDNALYVKEFVQDVNIHYLAQLLDISNLNQYAGKAAQPLVSGNRIYPLEMIFPPLQEQFKFEAIKVKYLESAKVFDSALLGVEAMFSSLSQKAFRGEL